jgi:DNA-binding transcriptional regulator GbsR (MarR family)
MSESESLSCAAKLARVVLDNCGPLAPDEVADEARLSEQEASDALTELEAAGFVDCVCGLCESRQQVYELADAAEDAA